MATRLYFDLKAVTDRAQHAILADRNVPTRQDLDLRVPATPALWYYRCGGRLNLCSNGTSASVGTGAFKAVKAEPGALPTPVVRPPDVRNALAIPLLAPDGQSLYDLLREGVAAHRPWAMLDPQTMTIGVGKRRLRTRARTSVEMTAAPGPAPVASY